MNWICKINSYCSLKTKYIASAEGIHCLDRFNPAFETDVLNHEDSLIEILLQLSRHLLDLFDSFSLKSVLAEVVLRNKICPDSRNSPRPCDGTRALLGYQHQRHWKVWLGWVLFLSFPGQYHCLLFQSGFSSSSLSSFSFFTRAWPGLAPGLGPAILPLGLATILK